jgi:hypothetical protein
LHVGAGVIGSIPSDFPCKRNSKPFTWAKSAASNVPGTKGAGPSVTSTSCSNKSGAWTAPDTWART